MPNFRPSPDLDMHYEVDDFTDPWLQPETILLLHGNAESGLAEGICILQRMGYSPLLRGLFQ